MNYKLPLQGVLTMAHTFLLVGRSTMEPKTEGKSRDSPPDSKARAPTKRLEASHVTAAAEPGRP